MNKQFDRTSLSQKMSSSVFGEEFESDWPVKDFFKHLTNFGQQLLQQCLNTQKSKDKDVNIQEFIKKSNEFPIKFPIDTCRVKTQPVANHEIIKQQISSAYPLLHERVFFLILNFLEHKLKYGTSREKQIYENMTPCDFVQRLLIKRCVSFVGFFDRYILITGKTGYGEKNYLKVGADEEEEPLTLNNVLSYDEVKIAALLSVSCHTEFINDGNRNNCGKVEPDLNKIEKTGVVVGLVGARFARPNRMEYEDIKITKQQNTLENGYGAEQSSEYGPSNRLHIWQYLLPRKNYAQMERLQDYRRLWNDFYEEQDYLYKNVTKDNKRFGECYHPDEIFNNLTMKKRFAISFDTLLLEANERALKEQKLAYIHVVGIGLGVWLAAPQQEKIFMESFQQRLNYLLPQLNNIGVIHFSWFHLTEWDALKSDAVLESETHQEGGIKILISKRNPNEKLHPPYENMLPVVSFAWDGNALPGNEFWMGSLHTSNDPSAACSTLITELFNPHINTEYVNGNNLHIASLRYGIIHVKDYVEKILNEQSTTQNID